MYSRRVKQALRLAGVGNGEGRSRSGEGHVLAPEFEQELLGELLPKLVACVEAQARSFPFERLQSLLARCSTAEEAVKAAAALLEEWRSENETPLGHNASPILAALAERVFLSVLGHWMTALGLQDTARPGLPPVLRAKARRRSPEAGKALCAALGDAALALIEEKLEAGYTAKGIVKAVKGLLTNEPALEMALQAAVDDLLVQEMRTADYEAHEALGALRKQWLVVRDGKACTICERNAAQGSIPLKEPFLSGHLFPRAHPHCRCGIACTGVTEKNLRRMLSRKGKLWQEPDGG